jgi:hypothetical protein
MLERRFFPATRLRPTRRPAHVNFFKDFLRPSDRIRDRANGCRGALPGVVLRQLPGRKDRGGNQQDALPPLIHRGILASSPLLRHEVGGATKGRPIC